MQVSEDSLPAEGAEGLHRTCWKVEWADCVSNVSAVPAWGRAGQLLPPDTWHDNRLPHARRSFKCACGKLTVPTRRCASCWHGGIAGRRTRVGRDGAIGDSGAVRSHSGGALANPMQGGSRWHTYAYHAEMALRYTRGPHMT